MDGTFSGFVAADAVASIVNEHTTAGGESNDDRKLPCIQGLLTFDTPFLGLANPMLAYSAFSQFSNVSSAYRLLSMLPAPFFGAKGGGGGGGGAAAAGAAETANKRVPLELGALPAWRTIAAYTGTTGALAAAGIAAYTNREELYQGYIWLQNHLQFVGVILQRRECRLKLARLAALDGFGFANMYTLLGPRPAMIGGSYMPERTFCAVPPATNPLHPAFRKAVNLVAKDELDAHSTLFQEERNPGYSRLLDDAQQLVVEWLKRPFHGYRTADLERKTTEAMANAEKATAAADAEQDLQAAALAAKTPLPASDDSDLAQEAGAENDANGS